MFDSGQRGTPSAQSKFENPRTTGPSTNEVGNFFAPFFDVVFYRAVAESGVAQASPDSTAREQGIDEPQSVADFGSNKSIGASSVRLQSSDGNSTLFEPDSNLANIRNFRSSLVLEFKASTAVKATLTLQPPYFDALKIVDNELIQYGSLMEIQWGYTNGDGGEPLLSDKGLFSIVQPSVKFDEQISIQITGWDILYMAASSLDRRTSWAREEYPTDLDIIKKVIERHLGETLKINTDQVASGSPLRKKKEGQPVVQTNDDFTFFRRMLAANDVEFEFRANTILLRDAGILDDQKPSYRLIWYGQLYDETDIPMISFNSNSIPSLFASQGSRGFWSLSHDLDKNQADKKMVKPEDTNVPQTGTKVTGNQEAGLPKKTVRTSTGDIRAFSDPDNDSSTGMIQVRPHDRPNQQQEADRQGRENRRLANTRASVIIPGHPSVMPLQIVNVFGNAEAGVGRKFSGNYRILSATHEIGQGYVTKLELLRASTSGDPRDSQPKSRDPSNEDATAQSTDEVASPTQEEDSPTDTAAQLEIE